ncbi:MAG: outer membrane protein assembly factor BamB family protein [Planctomycetota bacterium]|jgi:hypothetical protein
MAKRLWIVVFIAAAMLAACKSSKKKKNESSSKLGGGTTRTAALATDPVESALLSLGIDGGVSTLDLNQATYKSGPINAAQVHLLREVILVESADAKPRIVGITRGNLSANWISSLPEPSIYDVGEYGGSAFFVSKHYLTPIDLLDGQRTLRSSSGGLRRPPIALPFTPTAGAAGQQDTCWVPSLGSSVNNKKVESFSSVTGQRGWGWRALGDVLTSPLVGGGAGDPKLYFVTNTGIVTCLDALNYGFGPEDPRWEMRLASGVAPGHQPFLTEDTADTVGGLFVVDRRGTLYCVDRITGRRRWTNPTGRIPAGGPEVFGNLCLLPTSTGWVAYERDNVLYRVTVKNGDSKGDVLYLRNGPARTIGSSSSASLAIIDPKVKDVHLTFKVQGEVLTVSSNEDAAMRVDGAEVGKRSSAENGTRITIGSTELHVEDIGAEALWKDLPVDRIVCRVGDKLIVTKDGLLRAINAYTGEPLTDWVRIGAVRFIPTNAFDANLTVLVGDAQLYTLYPR